MTCRARVLAAAVTGCVAAVALAASAQDPPPARGLTFSAGVGAVRLDVTVVGPGGRFVTDLAQADFELLEDGQPQEIVSFLRRDVPVSLVLLLDASVSVRNRMEAVRTATRRFVGGLRPEDEVRVVAFGDRVSVLQELTPDRAAIQAALDSVSASGATALYNALYATFRNLPAAETEGRLRRRVVVLVSDGEDTASLVWEQQVLELVRRREATVHVIALRPEPATSNRSARLLRLLSLESGGEVHHPPSIEALDAVYGRIGEELRSQYTVGYVPSNAMQDAAWRRIDLRVRGRKDLLVRHRGGYYYYCVIKASLRAGDARTIGTVAS